MVQSFGLPPPTPFANAIQLLLTLKVPHPIPSHSYLRSNVTLYPTRRSASISDGESGQWGAEFPRGEAERRELLHQVVCCGGSIRGALALWRPVLQLLLYWYHDWWVCGSATRHCSATVSVHHFSGVLLFAFAWNLTAVSLCLALLHLSDTVWVHMVFSLVCSRICFCKQKLSSSLISSQTSNTLLTFY